VFSIACIRYRTTGAIVKRDVHLSFLSIYFSLMRTGISEFVITYRSKKAPPLSQAAPNVSMSMEI
jgi:hypothetical protein